jgi:hypothetical protein
MRPRLHPRPSNRARRGRARPEPRAYRRAHNSATQAELVEKINGGGL